MAYKTFVPELWAEKLERNNTKFLVFGNLVNRKWEGKIKEKGDTVHILTPARPTIGDYTGADIGAPEQLTGAESVLKITEAKYFNFAVDDIDKKQALTDYMDAQMDEANLALSEEEDDHIGDTAVSGLLSTNIIAIADATVTAGRIRTNLRKAKTLLWKNNIPKNTPICAVVSPDALANIEEDIEQLDTDNSTLIMNGYIGKTLGIELYVSTNVPVNGSGYEQILVFTKDRAIAHASQFSEVEAYRPEGLFADAIKGLELYGSKVFRPQEVVSLSVASYTAVESA